MKDPVRAYARKMMVRALRGGSESSGVHEAGLRKIEAQRQKRRSAESGGDQEMSEEQREMTHEQKRMSLRATAFVGLVFALTLESLYPDDYQVKNEGTNKSLNRLWQEIQAMPKEAKAYVIKSMMAFRTETLEERFQQVLNEAGISITGGADRQSKNREDF